MFEELEQNLFVATGRPWNPDAGTTRVPDRMSCGRAVQIFLSYRRADVGGHAGRLTDALLQRLGPKSVFQDVAAIAPGQDFTAAIDRALDDCDAALAVIGPGWLTASTPQGAPRLFEADDYVRLELARALKSNVRVVPVLVGGAALPAAAELPDALRGLARRQAVVLHDETWHQDVEGLVRSLRGEPAVPAKRSRRWLVTGVVAVALVALGGAVWWWGPGTGAQTGSENDLANCAPPKGQGWSPITLNNNPTGEEKLPDGSLVFRVKDARWRAGGGTWQVTLTTRMDNATSGGRYHADYRYRALIVGRREFQAVCFSAPPGLVSPKTVGDALIGFEVTCKPVGYIQLMLEDDTDRISVTPDNLKPGAC